MSTLTLEQENLLSRCLNTDRVPQKALIKLCELGKIKPIFLGGTLLDNNSKTLLRQIYGCSVITFGNQQYRIEQA